MAKSNGLKWLTQFPYILSPSICKFGIFQRGKKYQVMREKTRNLVYSLNEL